MDLIPRGFGFDDFFDSFIPEKHYIEKASGKCDIYEKDGKYFLEMETPGLTKDNVKIESEDGYVTITTSKEDKKEEKDRNYIRKERTYGSTQRKFYVGEINQDEIKAEFKDGILIVSFPKEEKKSNKKEIEIQ